MGNSFQVYTYPWRKSCNQHAIPERSTRHQCFSENRLPCKESLSSHDVSRLEDAEGSSAKCASEDHNLQSLVDDASWYAYMRAHTPHNFLRRLTMPGLSSSKVIIFLGFFDTCACTVSLPLPVSLTAAAKVSSESAVQPRTASLLDGGLIFFSCRVTGSGQGTGRRVNKTKHASWHTFTLTFASWVYNLFLAHIRLRLENVFNLHTKGCSLLEVAFEGLHNEFTEFKVIMLHLEAHHEISYTTS